MILMLITTLFGIVNVYQAGVFPINSSNVMTQLCFAIFGVVCIETLSRIAGLTRLASVGVLCAVVITICGNVFPLAASILLALSCYVLGRFALTLLRITLPDNFVVMSALIGVVLMGTVTGLMAHFPVNYAGIYAAALLGIVFFNRLYVIELVRDLARGLRTTTDPTWLDLFIGLIIFYYVLKAMMPEIGHDALAMHLFIPTYVEQNFEWSFDVHTYVWAVMPMLADWNFLVAYLLGGETGTRLTNVGFILIVAHLVNQTVLWAGGTKLGARWAAVLLLSLPLTGTVTTSLYIEAIWTALFLGGMLLLLTFAYMPRETEPGAIYKENSHGYVLVGGLLLGGAVATKAVTLTMLPALAVLLLFKIRNWFGAVKYKSLFIGLAIFLAIGIVPYLTALVITGNPVFPFFNEVFKAAGYPSSNFSATGFYGQGVAWDTLYRLTFESGKYLEGYVGAGGFHILLLLVPALFLLALNRKYQGMALLFISILAAVLTFQQTAYMRYIYPSYAIASAGVGVFLSIALVDTSRVIKLTALISAGLGLFLNAAYYKAGSHSGIVYLQALMSEDGRETYLDTWLPLRNAIEFVNEINSTHAPVAFLSSPLAAGLESDAIYANWYNTSFLNAMIKVTDANQLAGVFKSKNIQFVILDSNWHLTDKKELVEAVTSEVKKFGTVSVRRLSKDYEFSDEIIRNGRFESEEFWNLPEGVAFEAESLTATVSTKVTQVVAVDADTRLELSATAICPLKDTKGLLQVNWLDVTGKIISPSSKIFECKNRLDSHDMKLYVPSTAKNAIVYISGYTADPVTFKRVSLKK